MNKLIIQIPCYNEAEHLGITINALPRVVEGFSKVEVMIIDDGSTDGTAEVARSLGVDHIIRFIKNKGLANAFITGLDAAVRLGADVIVNLDADNQYSAADIPCLVAPILNGEAMIVIGSRPIDVIDHFSKTKKLLQKLGSFIVRVASRTDITDAPSGFRAISREAAMRLNVFNEYTYTLETIIQAGQKNIPIISVPIHTNNDLRPSRLVKSLFSYIKKSLIIIVRIFVVYKPFWSFMTMGLIVFFAGLPIGFRFLYFYMFGDATGHIQSLILFSILMITSFLIMFVAFLADLLSVNRHLLEDIQYRLRKLEFDEHIKK
jgi:glycosyltransferase involved in cell wall biosynthesis